MTLLPCSVVYSLDHDKLKDAELDQYTIALVGVGWGGVGVGVGMGVSGCRGWVEGWWVLGVGGGWGGGVEMGVWWGGVGGVWCGGGGGGGLGKTAVFWMFVIDQAHLLFMPQHSVKTNNPALFYYCNDQMADFFFAFQRQNYSW